MGVGSRGLGPPQFNITALYKKGDRCAPNNYRPVSLTSVVCRMLEAVIKDELIKYLDQNKLFPNSQHGFWSGHSCVIQLLTDAIESGKVAM